MTTQEPLRKALHKIRDIEPTPALEARVMRALVDAERTERLGLPPRQTSWWVSRLRISVPAIASVAIAAHFAWHDAAPEHVPFTEHRLDLPSDGTVTLPLSFSLDAHDTEFATLRVDVPHGLSVRPVGNAIHIEGPDCHNLGCVYEFLHPTTSIAPHVEVHVTQPGSFHVKVEHESESKLLRELVVVHAKR